MATTTQNTIIGMEAITNYLTSNDVLQAALLRNEAKAKRKEAEKLEALAEAATAKVVAIALGIQTKDELSRLSPEQLQQALKLRWETHQFTIEPGTPDFTFHKVCERRNVSWKEAFEKALGTEAALELRNQTQPTYSYELQVFG